MNLVMKLEWPDDQWWILSPPGLVDVEAHCSSEARYEVLRRPRYIRDNRCLDYAWWDGITCVRCLTTPSTFS
jgi:hypothetical protein